MGHGVWGLGAGNWANVVSDDETEQANRMEHDEAKELFAAPGVVRKRV